MMSKLYVYAGLLVFGAVSAGVSSADKSMNYVPVNASIKTVETDCYIENGKTKIVEKSSNKMAYMKCDLAPTVALMNDMEQSDIHYRSKLTFQYTSPVDNKRHYGERTVTSSKMNAYSRGKTVEIFAHKSEAEKYRWN